MLLITYFHEFQHLPTKITTYFHEFQHLPTKIITYFFMNFNTSLLKSLLIFMNVNTSLLKSLLLPSLPSLPLSLHFLLSQLSSASSGQPSQPKIVLQSGACRSWIDLKSAQRSFFEWFRHCLLRYSQNLDLEGQPGQLIYIIPATSA